MASIFPRQKRGHEIPSSDLHISWRPLWLVSLLDTVSQKPRLSHLSECERSTQQQQQQQQNHLELYGLFFIATALNHSFRAAALL